MARPKKIEKDLRNHYIPVHCSKEEKEQIIQKAKKNKMTCSRYVRECAISSDDSRLPQIRREAIVQIRKTGVNINQIAHHMNQVQNSGGSINYKKYFDLLEEYHKALKETLNALII